MGALRRCETEPQTRGSAGGGGQRVQCDEGTPRVADPSKQKTIQAMEAATTGSSGPRELIEAPRGALAGESETAGDAED